MIIPDAPAMERNSRSQDDAGFEIHRRRPDLIHNHTEIG